MSRSSSIVVAWISLIALSLSPVARADVSVRGDSGLNSKVNGQRDGSCKAGVCRVSGGRRGGRQKKILFHRLSELDTRGDRIKKIKLNIGDRKTKSVIVGVTNRKGSYLTTPFVLSGKADLILLSPGGVQMNGATFKNTNHLSLAATSHFKMGDGVFDIFKTSADYLNDLSLADERPLSARADQLLSDFSSSPIDDNHGQSLKGSIKISDRLSVDGDLLVVAKQPIKLKRAQLDINGDLFLESRLLDAADNAVNRDPDKNKNIQNMILFNTVDAEIAGDVDVISKSGVSDRSYRGLLISGSDLSVDGNFVASTQASSQSPFDFSRGIVITNDTDLKAGSIDLTGRGGNSSRRRKHQGIKIANSKLYSDQDLTLKGFGGDGRQFVDGVLLHRANLHAENGRLVVEGRGGNNAGFIMDGIRLLGNVSLWAGSDLFLAGKAGESRSPDTGTGIYVDGQKSGASIHAHRVEIVGIGADRDLESPWPKKVNKKVLQTVGVDVDNLAVHATSAVRIKGKGGFGNQLLDGVNFRNVNIQTDGNIVLKGVSGYSDTFKKSAGIFLDQFNLSAKNAKFIGRHASSNEALKGKQLDGIVVIDSIIDVQEHLAVDGIPAESKKIKDSIGVFTSNSAFAADTMGLRGIAAEYFEFESGRLALNSILSPYQQPEQVVGQNIGLLLRESTFSTRNGDLEVSGVGGLGAKNLHGVWLDQSTKLTANNGSLNINGVAGLLGSEMYGVVVEGSHLISDKNIMMLAKSSEGLSANDNIGIKLSDNSSVSAENIILNGKGGFVHQQGKSLDGVSIDQTQMSAENKIEIVGTAGRGAFISRSNGISLNKGSDLTADSIVLHGIGVPDKQPLIPILETEQLTPNSKNHGVVLRSATIRSDHDLRIAGDAGRGQELLDGVHLKNSHLFAGDGITIRGKGSIDANGTFKFSDGVYSSNSIIESDGFIELIGKGATGQKLEKNFGVELSSTKIFGSDVRIKGTGGIAKRKSVISSGVLISNFSDIQATNSVKIKGSSGSNVSNVRTSDGAAIVSSSLKSKTLDIKGVGVDGGNNVKQSSGVYLRDSSFDIDDSISIDGVSGFGNELKRSNGVDLVSTHMFSDTIKVSGSPFTTELSDASGFFNQGINIKRSKLFASKDVSLQGVGGFGIALLDGIDVQHSQLISDQSLSMVGVGGQGENISSSTGMIIHKNSTIQAPQLKMTGKGGTSRITEKPNNDGTYYNDGVSVVDSTIRSVQADPAVTSFQPESKLVIDGEGGLIESNLFVRGDLNSGVVFLDSTLRTDGSTSITGLAGKPPKGNTNTGVEIGSNSKLMFISPINNTDTEAFIFGKAYSGDDRNSGVRFKDSELHSSFDLTIVGDGAPDSTGVLNQGVRFKNGLVRVGDSRFASSNADERVVSSSLTGIDQPLDQTNNLTIKGLGGGGQSDNSGISLKKTDVVVSGTILLEGKIRNQQWKNNPSVYANGTFLSAGEDLIVDADYDAQFISSNLNAGEDILIRSKTLQLFDSSLNAGGEISLQSEDILTDSTELTTGRSDESTDSDSTSEQATDVTLSKNTGLSTRTLTLDEIVQHIINEERLSMDRLSKELDLEKATPMGLIDIQDMLRRSIQMQRK